MKEKPIIGLVMKSLEAEFFQEMKQGAIEYANKHTDFLLITVGTSTQTEIELQIELVNQLIREKVDAIVLVPIDSKALVPVTIKAIHAGIKVINIDIKLDEELLRQEGIELTYVGPDNKTASNIVGDVLAKKLKKDAKVILIEGLSVAENAQQRKAGFMESISTYGLNLIASEAADWETKKAEHVFERLFTQHPDVEGVMCSNDAMALGVLDVLKRNDKAGAIPVIGFDNDASVQPFLKSGALLATIDAFGPQMAVQGIGFALKVLNGMENKGSYSTDFKLIQLIK
jgi:ribose transport system substrate-binding protein